jgi:hypothetical protein
MRLCDESRLASYFLYKRLIIDESRTSRFANSCVLLRSPAKIDSHMSPRDSLGCVAAEKRHDLSDFLRLQKASPGLTESHETR